MRRERERERDREKALPRMKQLGNGGGGDRMSSMPGVKTPTWWQYKDSNPNRGIRRSYLDYMWTSRGVGEREVWKTH